LRASAATSQAHLLPCHVIMQRRLTLTIVFSLSVLCCVSPVSGENRLLVREVAGIECRATEPAYEFLLGHPAFSAALFGRLYPPLKGYSVSQPNPRRIRVVDQNWGLDGEADLLAEQRGKRIYRSEIGVTLTETWQLSAPLEIVLEYREARAAPDPLMVSRLAFYLLPPPTLPSVVAQAAAQLLVPLIDRQVQAVTEGSRRGCDRITSDPAGLYREMIAWPEIAKADLAAYHRVFLPPRP
jgi:hypothetical protein